MIGDTISSRANCELRLVSPSMRNERISLDIRITDHRRRIGVSKMIASGFLTKGAKTPDKHNTNIFFLVEHIVGKLLRLYVLIMC